MSDRKVEVINVSVNGIEMRYARFGSGDRRLVILPGLSLKEVTDTASAVEAAYHVFSHEYTVYLFDRRINIPDRYSVRQMASDTAEVMKAVGCGNACVFGASQGGLIALYLAAEYPELVSKLAVSSGFMELNDRLKKILGNWISLAEEGNSRALVENTVQLIYSEETVREYGEALIQSMGVLTEEELLRFRKLAAASYGESAADHLCVINCPVMVFGSEGDQVATAEASRVLADKLHAESVIYGPEYGHAVYDEAPDFKERLYEFFSGKRVYDRSSDSSCI